MIQQKDFYNFFDRYIARKSYYCLYICILFFYLSCANNSALQTRHSVESLVPAQRLVFIGLDGWGAAYVQEADMPTIKRMISDGASSMNVKAVMPAISWPNWSSLFFGASPEERTGKSQNNAPENIVDDFPSIFTLVKNSETDAGSSPVLFYEWEELNKLCTTETAEKIKIKSDIDSAKKIAAYIIEKKPLFTAIVFDQPDGAGHSSGWGSSAYYSKLKEMDALVTIIEQAVKDAGIYDSTVFVISSDHGGFAKGHGDNIFTHRNIPLVIYGKGIKNGFTISGKLSICDIAPTMAAILGLEKPPEWTGRNLSKNFK